MSYQSAISEVFPKAIQIADRFHIFRNFTEAIKKDLNRILNKINLVSVKTITESQAPKIKSKMSEKKRLKIKLTERIKKRYSECTNLTILANEFQLDYRTIKGYLSKEYKDSYLKRPLLVEEYVKIIDRMRGNKAPVTQIYEHLKQIGYRASYGALRDYFYRKTKRNKVIIEKINHRDFFKLLYDKGLSDLNVSDNQKDLMKKLLNKNKLIKAIMELVTEFRIIMYSKNTHKFDSWLEKAKGYKELTKLKGFISGTERDLEAVKNSIVYDLNNGRTEGFVNKIKLKKRIMYGRAKFDLLRKKFFL